MSKKSAAAQTTKKVKAGDKERTAPRTLQAPRYRSFKIQKRHQKPKAAKIQSSFKLFSQALRVLGHSWRLFLGVVAVYTVLNLLLVQGFFNVDLRTVMSDAQAFFTGSGGKLIGGFSGLGHLFSNSGADPTTGAYRVMLMVIMSLAVIWALRQLIAGKPGGHIRIRDTFYLGLYPLAPFLLVFLLICLQLAPLTLAMYLVGVVGATSGVEVLLWILIVGGLAVLTLYWLTSSVFALYIACLPDMQPIAAVRSAVQLVKHRRFFVLRRLLFLPFILFVSLSVVVVPLIVVYPPAAVGVFFVFLMIVLPVVHSYMYLLYRELLNAQ